VIGQDGALFACGGGARYLVASRHVHTIFFSIQKRRLRVCCLGKDRLSMRKRDCLQSRVLR
jgi:6-phosphogluconolactonase (cycloisomerase 2 family)